MINYPAICIYVGISVIQLFSWLRIRLFYVQSVAVIALKSNGNFGVIKPKKLFHSIGFWFLGLPTSMKTFRFKIALK